LAACNFSAGWDDAAIFILHKLFSTVCRFAGSWLAAFLVCHAAAVPLSPPEDDVVRVWDTDSGLPDSTVTSLAQTPDGYIWVGTRHGGLARFDGARFVNFDPENTPELKSIEVVKLLVDAAGTLWIGNVEGGLVACRDGHFRFEYLNNDTPRSWLEQILSDRPGLLEFSSRSGLVFRRTEGLVTNRWKAVAPPNASLEPMFHEDATGVIWYCTSDGLLAQLRGTHTVTLANPPGLRGRSINVMVTDAADRIWVGTDKELAYWDGKTFVNMTPTNGEAEVDVRQMIPCKEGGFWVLTSGHLRKCLARTWTVEPTFWTRGNREEEMVSKYFGASTGFFVDSRDGLWFWHGRKGIGHIYSDGQVAWVQDAKDKVSGAVLCWLEDHEGNIWVGLADGGLAKLRPRIFHVVSPDGGLDSKLACSVCEDEKGAIWFGTGGKQVWRWQDEKFTLFAPPVSNIFEETKVLPAGDGRLWVGSTQNGLMELKDGVFDRPFSENNIGTVVRCLYRDHHGALWIGCEFGLFRWDKGALKTFTIGDGFTPAYVLSITEDKTGDIWVGTALGELRRLHAGKFESFRPEDSRTDESALKAAAAADPFGARSRGALSGGERFWSLYFDNDDTLWIGTLGGGLLRFKDGRFTRFTVRQDLPSEHVSQILEDDRSQLWLGTRVGIVRVSKRELNEFADGGNRVPTFVTYGTFDGLPALQCSGGSQPNCWRGRDGRLWFTTVKGAVWVDPSALRLNRLPPPVRIEEVWVDGENIAKKTAPSRPAAAVPPQMRIAAGRHYFEFKFSALSFTSPDKVKFKWRLKGMEEDWVDGGDRHAVSYGFIPPGDYQFQVQACNNDGAWNETGAVVKLTVLPYFWQQWWFKVAGGLFLAAILLALYSVRVSRLRELERLRLRIARDLHDEVGANLGSISLLAQLMEQSPSSADAVQMRGIAVQTIDVLRDIIWFIDPTHDKLSDLVARLQETSRLMLQTMSFKFDQDGDFQSVDLPLAFRRNVLPLFKESLHNLLKHSHSTTAEILVRRHQQEFQFRIQDHGVGFDPAQKVSGNGIKNMRRRAAEIGGQIEIESRVGGGTTVTLTAPIAQTRDWW
jgi:signal transduction histidine kinase/ligand-binding sensor domain-containing protein